MEFILLHRLKYIKQSR